MKKELFGHLMIDLETLSTKPNAMIAAIGGQAFDESPGFGLGEGVRIVPDMVQQDRIGRHIDPATVQWWMKQADTARELFQMGVTRLENSLLQFSAFIDAHTLGPDHVQVWGNGADFDLVLLGSLYDDCNIKRPWKHYNVRCFRTLKGIHRAHYETAAARIKRVVHHDALDDARWQAEVALHILRKVNQAGKVCQALGALADPEDQFPLPDGSEKQELEQAWWDYDRS